MVIFLGPGVGSFSAEAGGDAGIGGIDGEVLRIEAFANHRDPLAIAGMRGIGEDSQQILIAPTAPTILRRAIPLSSDARRIAAAIDKRRRRLVFNHNYMLPVVAEVVGVGEAGDA